MTSKKEAFEVLGRAIAQQLETPLEQHVESAEQKLNDDDLVAFGLVAIRDTDRGVQSSSQRVIDPEAVRDSDHDPEQVINTLHDGLCRAWDEGVRDK